MKVFLFTPPFTQLNTPYPATAYLKGFLNTKKIASFQADLGIEVILEMFSANGLKEIFSIPLPETPTDNAAKIYHLKSEYIETIDIAIRFLQGHEANFAFPIAQRQFLPEAGRFTGLADLQWAFGSMGLTDQAKYIATLYLEDLADYIKECVDQHFGFSRYAERLGRSAHSFDELYEALQQNVSFIDAILLRLLANHMEKQKPNMVCISVPFPGNLYSAFRSAQFIKIHYPDVVVIMGGGFANTELREIADTRVFSFFDYICLDDGEAPLMHLIEYGQQKRPLELLKRTFALIDGKVVYLNNSLERDYKFNETGTPDYRDLLLESYISAVEIINPMHKLWSDGRWNKLTMAHGCYWGKCTFCDISLDYIERYEPATASLLCDHVEKIIAETGERSFHFVDEAAPPALMKAFALEIIRRKIKINWWTNIRFEKSFTPDLCLLLKTSGCIAVSGGLEVASDRLLLLIEKGVSVEGVARVAAGFTRAGILVHAYLMYGFPTETIQETVDSLEIVRQMFETGILRSAFWHQFALTTHSPVGKNPEKFGVRRITTDAGTFANNDLDFEEISGHDSGRFADGLKISLFNYMQQAGLELPLQHWFTFNIPHTTHPKNYIRDVISNEIYQGIKPNAKIYWLHALPLIHLYQKNKKGRQWEMAELRFILPNTSYTLQLSKQQGEWLLQIMCKLQLHSTEPFTYAAIKADFENNMPEEDFELFWYNKVYKNLQSRGLIAI